MRPSRRQFLEAIGAGVGAACLPYAAGAQSTSAQDQVAAILAELAPSGRTVVHAVDLTTGRVVASVGARHVLPIASVTKSFSACWALDQLGSEFQFETQVLSSSPILNGRLEGQVQLVGTGDPTFDTDGLQALVDRLKARGISSVSGGLSVGTSGFETIFEIDPEQPDHVQYNQIGRAHV